MGRDVITNYLLEYHDGTSWSTVTEVDSLTDTYVHTLSVPFPANVDRSDFIVKYRVSAKNSIGYGIISSELTVVTCTYPA